MKICLCQFSNKSSDLYNKLADISSLMIKQYCKLHNYEYIFEEISSDLKYHDMYFHKFEMLNKYIDKYDYLVWIDVDAIPINPNIPIESLIDEIHDFYISKDIMIKIEFQWLEYINSITSKVKNERNYFNDFKILDDILNKQNLNILNWIKKIGCNPHGLCSGFFIVKSSDICKKILNEALLFKDLFKTFGNNDGLFDQEALSLVLQKYEQNTKIFDYKFHGNMIYLQDGIKNEFSYDENNNFLCHMYSLSLENRINGFEIIKNNKFWKNLF